MPTSAPQSHAIAPTYAPGTSVPAAAPAARPARRPHIPALDGVRGMAALAVMCFHFGRADVQGLGARAIGAVVQFGWAGVDLFFVLSGFLITGILLDTRDRPGYFRSFYTRRALRIFPLYFFFVATFVHVIAPNLPGGAPGLAERQWWLWAYVSNFDVALHGWYQGVGSHANNLWSLAIEEQFYLVFPLAVYLLPRRGLALLAGAFVVGSLASRVALMHGGYPATLGYVLTFTRLDGLGLGALLALCWRDQARFARLVPWARAVIPAAAAVAIGVTLRQGQFAMNDWTALTVGLPALSFGFAALLVLTLAPNGGGILRGAFASAPARFLGRYSYGLYMWHPLVGRLVRLAGLDHALVARATGSSAAAVLVVLLVKGAASIAVALVSYALVERPFLALKDRRAAVSARPVVAEAAG